MSKLAHSNQETMDQIESDAEYMIEEASRAWVRCAGCDGHECDEGCAYPGAGQKPANLVKG